jgi:hypothetical protein
MAYQYPYDPVEEERRRQAEQFGMALPSGMTMRSAPPPPPTSAPSAAPPAPEPVIDRAPAPQAPPPPPPSQSASDRYNQMLQQGPPKPSWLQRAGAAALGFYQGYNNTNPRSRPVDMSGAQDRITGRAGYRENLGLAKEAADMEAQQAQQAQRGKVADAQIASEQAQAESSKATAELRRKQMNAPPPPAKPITVPAGAKVIMPDGSVVDNPRPTPEQKPITIPRGGSVLMPDGSVVQGPQIENKPIILPPGSKMVDATGKVLAQGNAPVSGQDSYSPAISTDDAGNVTAIPFNRKRGTFGEPQRFEGAGRKTKDGKSASVQALAGYFGGAKAPAPSKPTAPGSAQAAPAPQQQHKVGDTVRLKDGNVVQIKKIYPDGTFDY